MLSLRENVTRCQAKGSRRPPQQMWVVFTSSSNPSIGQICTPWCQCDHWLCWKMKCWPSSRLWRPNQSLKKLKRGISLTKSSQKKKAPGTFSLKVIERMLTLVSPGDARWPGWELSAPRTQGLCLFNLLRYWYMERRFVTENYFLSKWVILLELALKVHANWWLSLFAWACLCRSLYGRHRVVFGICKWKLLR